MNTKFWSATSAACIFGQASPRYIALRALLGSFFMLSPPAALCWRSPLWNRCITVQKHSSCAARPNPRWGQRACETLSTVCSSASRQRSLTPPAPPGRILESLTSHAWGVHICMPPRRPPPVACALTFCSVLAGGSSNKLTSSSGLNFGRLFRHSALASSKS